MLVVMTMYFVAGGEGCDGVPGRGDIKVRELGTLMMLGVRGPPDPLKLLCDTESVGRGYKRESCFCYCTAVISLTAHQHCAMLPIKSG